MDTDESNQVISLLSSSSSSSSHRCRWGGSGQIGNTTRATSGDVDGPAYMRMTHFHVMSCSQAPSPTIKNDPNLQNNKPTPNPTTTPLLICLLLPMNNDCMLDMVSANQPSSSSSARHIFISSVITAVYNVNVCLKL